MICGGSKPVAGAAQEIPLAFVRRHDLDGDGRDEGQEVADPTALMIMARAP